MAFAELHAQIDPDPAKELIRRLSMWASVPDENGNGLHPSSAIVPDVTVRDAVEELLTRRINDGVPGARAMLEVFRGE